MERKVDLTLLGVFGVNLKQFINGRINGELKHYETWEVLQIIPWLKEQQRITEEYAPYKIVEDWEGYTDDQGNEFKFQLLDKDGFDVCGEWITLEDAIHTASGAKYTIEYLPTY